MIVCQDEHLIFFSIIYHDHMYIYLAIIQARKLNLNKCKNERKLLFPFLLLNVDICVCHISPSSVSIESYTMHSVYLREPI